MTPKQIARDKEEKALLMKVLLEDAKTEEDVIKAKLSFDFLTECLEVRKVSLIMGLGKRKGYGKGAYFDFVENLVESYIEQEKELGLNELKIISVNDIDYPLYEFLVIHVIRKKALLTNKLLYTAKSESDALIQFNAHIKRLGHDLVNVVEVKKKKMVAVVTKSGDYLLNGTFDFVERQN